MPETFSTRCNAPRLTLRWAPYQSPIPTHADRAASNVVDLPARLVREGPRALPQPRRVAYSRWNLLAGPSQGFPPMQPRRFLRSGWTDSRTRETLCIAPPSPRPGCTRLEFYTHFRYPRLIASPQIVPLYNPGVSTRSGHDMYNPSVADINLFSYAYSHSFIRDVVRNKNALRTPGVYLRLAGTRRLNPFIIRYVWHIVLPLWQRIILKASMRRS